MKHSLTLTLISLLLLAALVACGSAPSTTAQPPATADPSTTEPAAEPSGSDAAPPATLRPVTLAMGFIPNVQFAPFYVAVEKGYFADEGIALTFDYGMENDLVQLVGANQLQFAVASGDQALLGRSHGLPVRYVANWYRRFPVAISSLEHDLSDPQVLVGKTVGLPGLFGANYIGWLALMDAVGIDPASVRLEAIGFNQVPVLVEGRVDAVVVYATNEPIQLEAEGYEASTLYIADYIELVANGLITNDDTIQNDPELVQGMVRAMLRGIADTMAEPDEAFQIVTGQWVPEASGDNAESQRAVLEASLPFWLNDMPGQVPAKAWERSQQFMLDAGLLDNAVPLEDVYTDQFTQGAVEP